MGAARACPDAWVSVRALDVRAPQGPGAREGLDRSAQGRRLGRLAVRSGEEEEEGEREEEEQRLGRN